MIFSEVTWGEIKQKFKTNGQASRLLDELYHYTRELSKDQPKEIVEAMSAYLFQLFLTEDMVLQKHVHMLKEMYGPVTHNQLNKIFQVFITRICIEVFWKSRNDFINILGCS